MLCDDLEGWSGVGVEWSRGEREAQDGVDIWILIADSLSLYSRNKTL